jgi:Tol biopolymer transport system component/DNA-binding winged helix-turn-helix (wHTH) protein
MEAPVQFPRTVVRFGVFELDLYARELLKRGYRVKLQDQPFQILAMLLEHPGQLVTREELRQRLWPGDTVVGFDDGLNAAIRRLRFALHDAPDRPKYIETLPRRGYRFIGRVENGSDAAAGALSPVAEPNDLVSAENSRAPESRRAAPLFIVVAGAVLTVIAAAAVHYLGRETSKPLEMTFTHITKAAGVEKNPTISPDANWIAYVAQQDGKQDIFLQRVGRDSAIDLTKDSASDNYEPAFSPDGRLITFRSERDGGGIFIMTPQGNVVRRVSDFGFDPAWSPDGKDLVVATEGIVNPLSRPSRSALWRVNIATGKRTRIFDGDAAQPSWSPHSHRIAFWGTIRNSGRRGIGTVPVDGGAPVTVTNTTAFDWRPVWSPDGKYLYFSSDRGGSMNLWRIAIDEVSGQSTGEAEAITTPARWSGDLSISRDGRHIAYAAADPHSNIVRVSFDPQQEQVTGGVVPLTHGTISMLQPAPSPDGQWVAYRTEEEQEDIYVSRIDGSERHKLTDDAAKDRAPSWSPDGKRIAFYSDRGGKYEAWAVDRDGTNLRQLTSSAKRPIYFPLWFRDGRRLVVNSADGSFIVTMSEKGPSTQIDPLPSYPEHDKVFRASTLSPDEKWLGGTLYSVEGKREPGIVVYSMDDRRYQVLTSLGSWPAWLSDGQRLAFGDRDGLYLVNRVTGSVRKIFSVDGQIQFGVGVAPDDKSLFFAYGAQESDIWLLTLR